MKRFIFLVAGFLVFFGLLPMAAEAQTSAQSAVRRFEERWVQTRICAQNSRSEYAFQECLRGKPLAGVIEGNHALVDDVVDSGRGGYLGSADSIVRGSVWGSGRNSGRIRQERRPPRTIISPVEGGITSGVLVGAATRSVRNGVVAGAATFGALPRMARYALSVRSQCWSLSMAQ